MNICIMQHVRIITTKNQLAIWLKFQSENVQSNTGGFEMKWQCLKKTIAWNERAIEREEEKNQKLQNKMELRWARGFGNVTSLPTFM